MSSLNADVEDGLNEDIFLPLEGGGTAPILPKTGVSSEPKKEMTIVTPVDNAIPSQNQNTIDLTQNAIPGQLPNIDAQFALIERGRTRVVDLKDVESIIVNQNAISQENAVMIDSMFGEFFHQRRSQKEFTSTPSKTHFESAKMFMRERIAKEEAVVVDYFSRFFSEPSEELRQFVERLKTSTVPCLTEEALSIQSQYQDLFEKIVASKHTVLPTSDQQFVNIVTTPIRELPVEKLDTGSNVNITPEIAENFFKALSALQTIIDKPVVDAFIQFTSASGEGEAKDVWKAATVSVASFTPTLNLEQLFKMYSSNQIQAALDALVLEADQQLETFNQLKSAAETLDGFEKLSQFIVENSAAISNVSQRIQVLGTTMHHVSLLNKVIAQLLKFMRYCI